MLKKVLVIDDSELIHRMYRLVLNRYNCEFGDAMDGAQGLRLLEEQDDFDLILLDINMPVMNGLKFMQHAADRGISARIPVIVISTEGKEEDTVAALKLGAKGYLKKPFNPADLHALIEKIFSTSSIHAAAGVSHLRMAGRQ